MKKSDIEIGMKIISPLGKRWLVVKKYSSDMWLIRRGHKKGMLCCLTAGQLRFWSVKRKGVGNGKVKRRH